MPEWMRWLPSGVLALGCVFTLAVDRQHPMATVQPLDQIPDTLAGRPGVRGTLPDDQLAAAGVSTYLVRRYEGTVAPFEIYVGYYEQQTQGRTIHSPKNCLPGSGWVPELSEIVSLSVPGRAQPIPVNRYVVQKGDEKSVVMYWYQSRDRVVASEYEAKFFVVADAIRYNRTDTALVRIVVPAVGGRTADAAAAAARFARDSFPLLTQILPQ